MLCLYTLLFFFFKQKTAYEMRISDWSSDVCSSDLAQSDVLKELEQQRAELDQLTSRVIERGLASWAGSQSGKGGALILRGQSLLLEIGRASCRERVCQYV